MDMLSEIHVKTQIECPIFLVVYLLPLRWWRCRIYIGPDLNEIKGREPGSCKIFLDLTRFSRINAKNGQTWQACQRSKVVQKGPKMTKMVNLSVFLAFGIIIGPSGLFWTISTKI